MKCLIESHPTICQRLYPICLTACLLSFWNFTVMKKIVLRHNGRISYKRMQDKGCFAQWVKWVHRLVSVWDRIPQTCVKWGREVDGRKSKDLSWKVSDCTGENRRDCVSCTVKDDDRYQKSFSASHTCACAHIHKPCMHAHKDKSNLLH